MWRWRSVRRALRPASPRRQAASPPGSSRCSTRASSYTPWWGPAATSRAAAAAGACRCRWCLPLPLVPAAGAVPAAAAGACRCRCWERLQQQASAAAGRAACQARKTAAGRSRAVWRATWLALICLPLLAAPLLQVPEVARDVLSEAAAAGGDPSLLQELFEWLGAAVCGAGARAAWGPAPRLGAARASQCAAPPRERRGPYRLARCSCCPRLWPGASAESLSPGA
jgi:hypothetical protein